MMLTVFHTFNLRCANCGVKFKEEIEQLSEYAHSPAGALRRATTPDFVYFHECSPTELGVAKVIGVIHPGNE